MVNMQQSHPRIKLLHVYIFFILGVKVYGIIDLLMINFKFFSLNSLRENSYAGFTMLLWGYLS